ncbi:DNA-dependent protein kinase catalytic subunit [Labeo rohita]|uniref:DNA-dependent protein kinase catalytic subunit n=1 Tax=Labeo rohita TaxID=84645 RepID=A0ABQ8L995_LABRO|nr:DNA-dependent protein kinase catalytic subunit [Labeo rohita]
MVLEMCRFGSSPQKWYTICSCSVSCTGISDLKKYESVEVYVEYQSVKIYNEIHEVSSFFNEEGNCSVVVPDCLQENEMVVLTGTPSTHS